MKKLLRNILLLSLAVFLLAMPVFAADGSITVFCALEEEPLVGVSFALYPADGHTDTAAAYAAVIEAGQAPVAEAVTNGLGNAVFSGLTDGTYLVVGQPYTLDGQIYEFDMSLVTLPGTGVDGQPVSNVMLQSKFTLRDAAQPVNYRVLVIWDDGGYSGRPESVPVHLYRNGQIFGTVTVSKEENWQYDWEEVDPAALWAVSETVPEKYTVSYDRESNTFIIRNHYTAPVQPGPVDPSLPQTGQLWWPVPVLAMLGMILLVLGWFRKKELRNEG